MRRFSCLVVGFIFVATTAGAAAEWQTDYDQALVAAKSARKCVLIDFTGSDWCPP